MAQAGFGIVCGSFFRNTADHHLLRGALKVPGARTLVIRPESEPPGRDDEAFRDVPLERHPGDWETVRPKQVSKADAIVLIAGDRGTQDILRAARSSDRPPPILLIPAFGGFAAKEYERDPAYRDRYLELGLDEVSLRHLEHWNDSTPQAVVNVLRLLLGLIGGRNGASDDRESLSSRFSASHNADYASDRRSGERASYLLTWDPARSEFDGFEKLVRAVTESRKSVTRWSVGWPDQKPPRQIKDDDRVFFMRHGAHMPGLVGSGKIISEVREDEHWDEEWAKQGGRALYADVQ